tara:strand:+ start:2357 stop:2881 length:525 start_codon:yes stop_codon:yes gene_type:complete
MRSINEYLSNDIIPMDIIIWTLQHYYTHDKPIVDIPNITPEISKEGLEFGDKFFENDGYLYRGINLTSNQLEMMEEEGGIVQPSHSSWTYNEDTAEEFAQKALLKRDISKFNKVLVIDHILKNVNENQIDQLKKIKHGKSNMKWILDYYSSESEVICFDDMWIDLKEIHVFKDR